MIAKPWERSAWASAVIEGVRRGEADLRLSYEVRMLHGGSEPWAQPCLISCRLVCYRLDVYTTPSHASTRSVPPYWTSETPEPGLIGTSPLISSATEVADEPIRDHRGWRPWLAAYAWPRRETPLRVRITRSAQGRHPGKAGKKRAIQPTKLGASTHDWRKPPPLPALSA